METYSRTALYIMYQYHKPIDKFTPFKKGMYIQPKSSHALICLGYIVFVPTAIPARLYIESELRTILDANQIQDLMIEIFD